MTDIEQMAKVPLMRIADNDDYRMTLKSKFLVIKARNPRFSIAVLARKIGCSDSFIKKLFARRAHLGFKYVETLATALELNPAEENLLFLHVLYFSVDGERVRRFLERLIEKSKCGEFHL